MYIICHFERLKNNNRILILVLIERVIFFIHRALIEAKNTLASNKDKVGFKTDCIATKRTVGRENKAGIQQYKNDCHACMQLHVSKAEKVVLKSSTYYSLHQNYSFSWPTLRKRTSS